MSGITKRQAHLIDMAATHADDFKTRVARQDEESSFPHENMQAMKNSGYSAFVVPKKFGGLEATPLETAMAQERLAYGDLPSAIAINMHIISLSMVTDLWWLAEKREEKTERH